MSLRFCSLSSSSSANCYYIESSRGTGILVDAGIPLRRLEQQLHAIGVSPASLQGVFLTHAHRDHVASYLIKKPFATRYQLHSYASTGTWREMMQKGCGELDYDYCHRLEAEQSVQVGDLVVKGYAKPHDAAGALCYEITDGEDRLAVVTDLGYFSDALHAIKGCHYLIFEANHDVEMERRSDRPWSLKQRVLGDYGHLSNEQAAAALTMLAENSRGIWLAHLSEECNNPKLAKQVVEGALRQAGIKTDVYTLPPRSHSPFYGCQQHSVAAISLWDMVAEKN